MREQRITRKLPMNKSKCLQLPQVKGSANNIFIPYNLQYVEERGNQAFNGAKIFRRSFNGGSRCKSNEIAAPTANYFQCAYLKLQPTSLKSLTAWRKY